MKPVYWCDACFDRKYIIRYRFERGSYVVVNQDCPRCSGNGNVRRSDLDPELNAALTWFVSATTPMAPFKIGNRIISDVDSFWTDLKEEVRQRNVYIYERNREALISLYKQFGGEDF